MFTIKTKEEFIADIRKLDEKLKKIRLSQIEIDRKEKRITYRFICNETVDALLKERILSEIEKFYSPSFEEVGVEVTKIASDNQLVNVAILEFLRKEYPSISIFLKEEDISSTIFGDDVKYVVRLTKDGAVYAKKNGVFEKLNAYLATKFCSEFMGSSEEKEIDEVIDLSNEEVFKGELEKIERRTIKVLNPVVIDDLHMGDIAYYIEDCIVKKGEKVGSINENITLSGNITEISERKTQKGKPFFIVKFNDTTGDMSGLYFTKKSTYDKIKYLSVGDGIICRGRMGEYGGKPSFTIDKINRCTFPQDFVKVEKLKTEIPKAYTVVKPQKSETIKTLSLFGEEELPKELVDGEFVVFDLETTGLEVNNNGITEIGAVKIKGGKIVEHFHTLIEAEYPVGIEAQRVSGITDDMIKGSPRIESVMPDFIKFIHGTTLVAQNASFDMKYIKKYASKCLYPVENKVLDTMVISREVLPQLRNNDLATLANHFNIVFHHHRALSDAYATAEIFIELLKIKYKKS